MTDPRHLAGVLVHADPATQEQVAAAIDALPWAEVHHRDGEGRMIAVVEGADAEEEAAHLMRLREVPGVLGALPVVQYFDEAGERAPSGGPAPEDILNDPAVESPPSYFRRLKSLGSG